MNGFELNKIAGAILLAGLIAMIAGTIADAFYEPETPEKRGFEVAVVDTSSPASKEPEKPIDIGALLASADATAGQASSKKCGACHSMEKGGPNKVGPGLWGVVLKGKAAHEGYSYSPALAGFPDKSWNDSELFKFINNPRKHIPGTKMGFAGASPEETANIVAYIKTLK